MDQIVWGLDGEKSPVLLGMEVEDDVQTDFLEKIQLCFPSPLGKWVLPVQLTQNKTIPYLWNLGHSLPCFQWLLVASTSRIPAFWLKQIWKGHSRSTSSFPWRTPWIKKKKKVYFKKQLLAFLVRYKVTVYLSLTGPWTSLFWFHLVIPWDNEVPGFPHNYLVFVPFHDNYFALLKQFLCHLFFKEYTKVVFIIHG